MTQYVYWHAALWEVLLMAAVFVALLVWLVGRILHRANLTTALAAVKPALRDQPLFFFDFVEGITCLNDAAQRILDGLPDAQRQFLLNVLTETLLEALTEARPTQQPDWPEPGCVLFAAPVAREPDDVQGVLAMVTAEAPLPPASHPVEERSAEDRHWLPLGPALRLHRTRPVARVRRAVPAAIGGAEASWQKSPLSHLEETLLRHLVEHQAEVQAVEVLFRAIWPKDPVDEYGLRADQKERLRRLVFQVRQRVEPDPRNPRYLRTAHGVGYALYPERDLTQ
jgi:hypothetical protein